MNRPRLNRLTRSAVVTVVVLAAPFCWSGPSFAASNAPPAGTGEYDRPPAETVRAAADQILSEARFKERWSFWQWLRQKFVSRTDSNWSLGGPFWQAVYWIVIIWCCLALLAILAHLIWTIWTLVAGGSWLGGAGPQPARFRKFKQLSYQQLIEKMRRLAGDGQYRRALTVMMLALLRRLSEMGAISFHESKTNGDYVREYSPAFAGRDEFGRFVARFDSAIYGRATKPDDAYRDLYALFEHMQANAANRQKI